MIKDFKCVYLSHSKTHYRRFYVCSGCKRAYDYDIAGLDRGFSMTRFDPCLKCGTDNWIKIIAKPVYKNYTDKLFGIIPIPRREFIGLDVKTDESIDESIRFSTYAIIEYQYRAVVVRIPQCI